MSGRGFQLAFVESFRCASSRVLAGLIAEIEKLVVTSSSITCFHLRAHILKTYITARNTNSAASARS